jgi:hypothetical protein
MSKTQKQDLTHRNEKRPRRITVWVVVPCSEHRTAERLAKDYAPDGLEGVLAAFVSDMATMATRPGSWEADRVGGWLASHPWPRPEKEGA